MQNLVLLNRNALQQANIRSIDELISFRKCCTFGNPVFSTYIRRCRQHLVGLFFSFPSCNICRCEKDACVCFSLQHKVLSNHQRQVFLIILSALSLIIQRRLPFSYELSAPPAELCKTEICIACVWRRPIVLTCLIFDVTLKLATCFSTVTFLKTIGFRA